MYKLLGLGLLSIVGCAADAPAEPHDVAWGPRAGTTLSLDACIGIRVTSSPEVGASQTVELPCAATTTVVMSDPDDPLVQIEVDYLYWMIPFGCESDACWVEATMATGAIAFDATAPSTIIIEPVINLPF